MENEVDFTMQPNIILINCDDLGYGDLGCYGSKVHQTPVLDRLADEGVRFTSFYMASSVCSPSRGAMMTGCYPPRIGFGSFDGLPVLFPGQGLGLHPEEKTIASVLKDAGYRTMHIGKWHCGDQPDFLPTRHGFDHYYGLPYSNDMGRQLGDDENGYPPLPLLLDEEVLQEQPDQTSLTERYVEQGVRFIRESKNEPFFLYFAHMHVHLPLYAPERFMKQSRNGAYGASVECIDWAAGVLVHELKRQGLSDNTLIIFTSDNGSRGDFGESNGPLRGAKATTWEGGFRVPCIMHWPGRIPAGIVRDDIVTSMDFYPTLAKLANGSVPTDRIIDGVDISSLLLREEGSPSPRDTFFYYMRDSLKGVRHGRWKLHVRSNTTSGDLYELYDLESDIGETTNLAEEKPEIVAQLKELLDACRQDLGDESTSVPGANLRPIGRVDHPTTLTQKDSEHPYIEAMYDCASRG